MAARSIRRILPVVLAAAFVTARGADAQSIFEDTDSEQVEQATDLEQVKVDLALCAPHLAQLKRGPDARAMAETVEDPQCQKAVRRAQAAGLSKAEIVNLLMGASDVPDSGVVTVPHGGPPVVVD